MFVPIYKFVFVQNNIVLKMFFLFFLNQIELKPPLSQSRAFSLSRFSKLDLKKTVFFEYIFNCPLWIGLFRDCLASLSLAIKINYHLRLRNTKWSLLYSLRALYHREEEEYSFELCQKGLQRDQFRSTAFSLYFYQYLFGLSQDYLGYPSRRHKSRA